MLRMLRQFAMMRKVQKRLKIELSKCGIEFMQMRPDVHAYLLQEAARSGNPEMVASRFVRTVHQVAGMGRLSNLEKHRQLIGLIGLGDASAEMPCVGPALHESLQGTPGSLQPWAAAAPAPTRGMDARQNAAGIDALLDAM
jgi:hypothetical protein